MTRPGSRTWQLSLGGSPETVELVPYSGRLGGTPSSFRIGTIERKLEYPADVPRSRRWKTPLVGSVDIEGHCVTMTLTPVRLLYRTAVRRTGLRRTLWSTALAGIIGGAGAVDGTAAAAQSTLAWLIYELSVDGDPHGSWVATTVDALAERWTFVPAGGALPDSNTLD
jgi:hypothetical protein